MADANSWSWIFIILIVVLLLAALAAVFFFSGKRGVRKAAMRVDESWDGVKANVRKRAALVDEMSEALEQHAPHEADVAGQARQKAEQSRDANPTELSEVDAELRTSVRRIVQVAGGYPNLSRDREFLQLQSELGRVEQDIQTGRRFYNGAVREYNTRISTFPGSMAARGDTYGKREFFEANDRAAIAEPPRVQF